MSDLKETLAQLSQPIDAKLVKQREGWTRRDGSKVMVDYISWSTAADLLDQHAPDWEFDIEEAYYFDAGGYWVCRATITINGVKRRGIGTGQGLDEKAVKKAEHDALKRAAVKFGIGRELYRDDDDAPHGNGFAYHGEAGTSAEGKPQPKPMPANPLAKSVSELATPKQIVMIRAICRDLDIDVDTELQETMKLECKVEELSRRAASSFIDHLKQLQENGDNVVPIVRRSH